MLPLLYRINSYSINFKKDIDISSSNKVDLNQKNKYVNI